MSVRRGVALIGAECSGKSTLARQLASALPASVVPEYLRTFVEQHGRVPSAHEQRTVLEAHVRAEGEVSAGWMVSDSGALMTAVYSTLYYDDASLVPAAVEHHRRAYIATLWCDIDLPWTADEGQRDGPQYRRRGHEIIGEIVAEYDLAVVRVSGDERQRLAEALSHLRRAVA